MFKISNLSKILLKNVSLGNWFGVHVKLHSTWIFTFFFFALLNPNFALCWFALFCIIVMHEFGHIFAGKLAGCQASDVTLYAFGGAARMTIPKNPIAEFFVALAGPMVNLLLIPFLESVSHLSPILLLIFYSNLGLIFFNLLPVFPMDGGRVLRTLLQIFSGNRKKSTLVAVRISQVFCMLFIAFGIYDCHIMLALIGIWIFGAAQNELDFTNSKCIQEDLLIGILFCELCKQKNICTYGSNKMISSFHKALKDIDLQISKL
jgi:stage IV sporulation protein FB